MESSQDLQHWAESRETTTQIAEAIWSMAEDAAEAQRIWADPTDEEFLTIWERVTKNGLLDGTQVHWGGELLASFM